jgi:hypothetical protein
MNYAEKRVELIEKHNNLGQQVQQLTEAVQQTKVAMSELRGQVALLDDLIKEETTSEGEEE